jgi:hypothetical protein
MLSSIQALKNLCPTLYQEWKVKKGINERGGGAIINHAMQVAIQPSKIPRENSLNIMKQDQMIKEIRSGVEFRKDVSDQNLGIKAPA